MTPPAALVRRRAARPGPLTPAQLLAVRAALAAGASPSAALAVVDAPSLAAVRGALASGVTLPSLVRDQRDGARADGVAGGEVGGPAGPLVRALAMAELVGAPAGAAVDGVIDAVTATTRLDGLVRVRSAQARASARFLVGMPVAGAALLALVNPDARRFSASPLGLLAMAVALVLIVLAHLWIRRLSRAPANAAAAVDPLTAAPPSGPDPTAVVAVVVAVLGSLVVGPSAAVPAAVVRAVVGGPLRRRVAAAGDPTPAPPARPPSAAGGTLPTVETLELLGLALAAGPGLAEACRLTAALGPPASRPAWRDIAGRLAAGEPPTEAFGTRFGEVADLIAITERWGAPVAQALRSLAADLRHRAATAAEEAAERLAVRLVLPTTLLLVPAFGLLVVLPAMAATLGGVRLGP